MRVCLAVDIGASSGRHIAGWMEDGQLRTREVYRFSNGVCRKDGHLIWDIDALEREVLAGIRACFREFRQIHSLSIDTWGVDYVLLAGDSPILPVYAYRDSRTESVIPEVHGKIPFSDLYRYTGCQFQPFNTIYQLYRDKLTGRLSQATDMLMIPEYLLYRLCGIKAREYTNATTTGMVSAETGQFHRKITETLGYPEHLFPQLQHPGSVLGELLPEVAESVGGSCKVILCATHDTASAVEGIGMAEDVPYISSGTWSLLGVKTQKPLTDSRSLAANYSNEGGVGYNRYQKNIMGLWLVEQLRLELCPDSPYDAIIRTAEESSCNALVNANDPTFLSPGSMVAAFDRATGYALHTPGDYFRCAFASLALSYRDALHQLEENVGTAYAKLCIVGGGAKNHLLNRLTQEATGKTVVALPIEATALGNLKIQLEVFP